MMENVEPSSPPAWARLMIQQMAQAAANQEESARAQEERIRQLEELIQTNVPVRPTQAADATHETHDRSRETNEDPNQGPVDTNRTRRPRARLPDPPTFKGTRTEWPVFRMSIENKLLLDAEALGDERACLLYVYSRLEGNASKNTVAFMQHRRANGNASDLIQYLENIYGDPNIKKRATQRLREIR